MKNFGIIFIFLITFSLITILFLNLPKMKEYYLKLIFSDEYKEIKLPRNIKDVKILSEILSRYTKNYYFQVLFSIFALYILYLIL
jgi:hypothetical protein